MTELIEVFRSLINDYEETFRVMENGTIKVNNESFERHVPSYGALVQNFLNCYDTLFLFDGLEMGAINIEIIGYRKIEKVN
ncbi:13423_t:CDS:2 [Funneliformis caledonium]|uniref:13423_t:CDS:1 n=1 Tax=Funneliformis caledonium TaxID=1117310 RepID=A0A9N9HB09_9GLOM|nr:13423_t:CDS:2 [Funneliformis caledonium]